MGEVIYMDEYRNPGRDAARERLAEIAIEIALLEGEKALLQKVVKEET